MIWIVVDTSWMADSKFSSLDLAPWFPWIRIFHMVSSHAAPCRAWGFISVLIFLLPPKLQAVQIPPELTGMQWGQAKLPVQREGSVGTQQWCQAWDCRWNGGNGEGGLMPWELPLEQKNMFPYPRKDKDLWEWDQRRPPCWSEGWSTSPKAKRIAIVQARKGFRVA